MTISIIDADITTLSASAFAALTVSEIKSLSSTQCAAIVPSQLSSLPAEKIAALSLDFISTSTLTGISTSAINGLVIKNLSNEQIQALTTEQVSALTAKKFANFSPEQLTHLTTMQIAVANLSALDSEQVGALTAAQLSALNSSHLSSLSNEALEGLNSTYIAELNTTQITALASVLKPNQLNEFSNFTDLDSQTLTVIPPETLKAINANISNINQLTPQQIAQLTPEKLANLSNIELAAITPQQASVLRPSQLMALNSTQATQLTSSAIAAIRPIAIKYLNLSGFDNADMAALTTKQVAYLTVSNATQIATNASGLTATQINAMKLKSLQSLSTAARDTLGEDAYYAYRVRTNHAPTATNLDAVETYIEDTPLNLNDIVVTDIDDNNISVTLTLSNSNTGNLNVGTSNGVTSNFSSGVWTASGAISDVNTLLAGLIFTPAADFNGSFTITTNVVDEFSLAITGNKSFTGTAINDAPVITSSTVTTNEDATKIFSASDFSVTDTENNALSAVIITSLPAAGTLTLNNVAVTVNQEIPIASIPNLTFTPAVNANGANYASFGFKVKDDGGTANGGVDISAASTMTVNVTAVNDAPIFSGNGVSKGFVTTDISATDSAKSAVLQADGKIIVVGSSVIGTTNYFTLARYNTNGSLDTTFGSTSTGKVVVQNVIGAVANDIAVQTDGKIVVIGSNAAQTAFITMRFLANGTLDTSFDTDGIISEITAGQREGYAIAIKPTDDNIVVAGRNNFNQFLLTEYLASNGAKNTAVDSDGIWVCGLGGVSPALTDVLVQPDGKVIAVGQDGANAQFALARFNANGSLDTNFDTDGIVTTNVSSGAEQAHTVALQSDGKIVVGGHVAENANDIALVRYNANGSLDTSFGTNGIIKTALVGSDDVITSVAIQADGKILASGVTGGNFLLMRYNTDGTPDSTFGTAGKVTKNFGGNDVATKVLVQNDGKIVVTGTGGANNDFIIARYDSNGTLDSLFDDLTINENSATSTVVYDANATDLDSTITYAVKNANDAAAFNINATTGVVTFQTSPDYEIKNAYAFTVQVLEDGVFTGLEQAVSVAIGNVNEVPIATSSTVTTNEDATKIFSASDFSFTDTENNALSAVIITSLPAAGTLKLNGVSVTVNQEISVASIPNLTFTPAANANGTNYASFGFKVKDDGGTANGGGDISAAATMTVNVTAVNDAPVLIGGNGKVTTNLDSGWDTASSVALQSDNKLVVAGWSYNAADTHADFALVRYDNNGNLDNSFGTNGKVKTVVSGGNNHIQDVEIQTNGKILVAGSANTGTVDFALVRYNTDGSLDTSFSSDGIVTTGLSNGGNGVDSISAIALQSDGKIVAAGSTNTVNNYDFSIARYNTDGSLDNTFGSNGVTITAFNANIDGANALAMQSDGKIVLAGTTSNGTNNDIGLARYNSDGTLDTTFGTGGKITESLSSGNDSGNGITIQSDDKILVSGTAYNATSTATDFALLRYTSTGVLDTSFGVNHDGKVTTPISGYANGRNVVVQPDGKILVAGSNRSGTWDFVVARYTSEGLLDTSFGTNGYTLANVGVRWDTAYNMLLQPDGKIVVVGENVVTNGSDNQFATIRYNSDGSLDTSFNTSLVTGTPIQGQTLSIATSLITDAEGLGTFSYQWKKTDGTIIATTSTLLLTQNEVGQTITATVSYTDANGTAESITSSPTSAVININDAPIATNSTVTINEDTTKTFTVSDFSFTDLDNNALSAVIITSLPTAGTLKLNNSAVTLNQAISAADISSGLLTFTPAANANGTNYANFDFKVKDNGGTANSGVDTSAAATMTFNVTAVNDYLPQTFNALNFDGTNDFVDLPDISLGSTFTLEAWVNVKQHGTWSRIIELASAGAERNNNIIFGFNGLTGKPVIEIDNGATNLGDITAPNPLPINSWHHLAAVVNGMSAKIYVDGVEVQSGTFTGSAPNTVRNDIWLGKSHFVSMNDAYFNGAMDELRIWNTARTAADIQANMNNQLSGSESGLVAYYNFNQNSGTTLLDSASTTNNGTLTNFALSGETSNWINFGIKGSAIQNQTLTIDTSNLSDGDGFGAGLNYQWKADGVAISGATSSTYTLTQNEVGKTISATVSYTDGGGTPESITAAPSMAGAIYNPATGHYYKLTASNATWHNSENAAVADGGHLVTINDAAENAWLVSTFGLGQYWIGLTDETTEGTFVWASGENASYRNWGANEPSNTIYYPAGEDYAAFWGDTNWNDALSNGNGDSYESFKGIVEIPGVVNVNDLPTGTVSISGTAQVGQTLTASNDLADADGLGTISYQWKANGTAISGATNSTYTLLAGDANKTITATASYTDGFGANESVTSAATSAVIINTAAPTFSVSTATNNNNAFAFNGSNGFLIPRSISNDFTIEFWMKTTQVGGALDWWTGKGLVDAETAGVSNDFGVTLSGGNTIGFGTGPTDITIHSEFSANTGNWKHVAALRENGYIMLYIDGVYQQGYGSDPVSLTSPANIGIGRMLNDALSGQSYIGEMDELRIWNYARVPNNTTMNGKVVGNEAGLMNYYSFDSGTSYVGTTAGAKTGIYENSSTSLVIYDANATDIDGNTLTYSLKNTGDYSLLNINSTTGEVKFNSSPDYEAKQSYSFIVQVSDGASTVDSTLISIPIIDIIGA